MMGMFGFLFKRKREEENNYDEIRTYSWDFFKEGLLKESPKLRREIEEALLNIDSPQGRRFFSAALQEYDLDNKIFCLKNVYKRGGWRLAENLFKLSFSDELEIKDKLDIISFLSDFADPFIVDFLKDENNILKEEIKIPILCCLITSRSKEASKLMEKYIDNNNEIEKLLYSIILYQFNIPEGKKELDKLFLNKDININYFRYLKYLEFNKSKFYFEKNLDKNKDIQLIIINSIKDNRGFDFIRELIKSKDKEVIISCIEKIIELDSRELYEAINSILLIDNEVEKYKEYCKANFGDKNTIDKLISTIDKDNINIKDLEKLEYISSSQENDISPYLYNILENKYSDFLEKKLDIIFLEKVIRLLIKTNKMKSVPILKKYVNIDFLEKNDLFFIKIASLSSAAILSIIEKNTGYMHKKENLSNK